MIGSDPSRATPVPWLSHSEYRLARALTFAFEHWRLLGLAAGGGVLLVVAAVSAGIGSLPPSSRPDAICQALGTEAPCDTEEIGHVKGVVTVLADDGVGVYSGVLLGHGQLYAATLGATDEMTLLERVSDPTTNWSDLVLPSALWPTLRAIAKVDDGVGVLRIARTVKGGTDGTGSAMATTAKLRVRIALVVLR